MTDFTIGKYILDNLTTGMYIDPKMSFREYIQNACDQIDIAISMGLITKSEARIDIDLDSEKRIVTIIDNATGAGTDLFGRDLGDIANSQKSLGEQKGFRGIGRLIGLAYCKTLKFTSSCDGETVGSIMICDAKKMREILEDQSDHSTLDQVWDTIVSYDTFVEDCHAHYFKVEMIGITEESLELLDEVAVKSFLEHVAPVPYKSSFPFRQKILNFAKEHLFTLDEYNIYINQQQVFKPYVVSLKNNDGVEYDRIAEVDFHIIQASDGRDLAWMWYGLCAFDKVIPSCNAMRCIRLRTSNIEIGDEDTLRSFFKEGRGNGYYVGEVFSINRGLIPNSHRDYYNANAVRSEFELQLKRFCYDILHNLYYDASRYKRAHRDIESFETKKREFEKKETSSEFIDEQDRLKAKTELEEAEKRAKTGEKTIETISAKTKPQSPASTVIRTIQKKYEKKPDLQQEGPKENNQPAAQPQIGQSNGQYLSSTFTSLGAKEQKLMAKVLSIISRTCNDKSMRETIIEAIKKELK